MTGSSRMRGALINGAVGVGLTLALWLIIGCGVEIYLRSKHPFTVSTWPTEFDKRFGWLFMPDSVVHWTNNVDYWTMTKASPAGFLDREFPPAQKDSNECRVLFFGDSFLEAVQVPIEQKVHVVSEKVANARLSNRKRLRTVAMAYSGTGQVNQLAFYDTFADSLNPDIIVLLFVGNDFADNSTLLESVRQRWHPWHPPRLFVERRGGQFVTIPIDTAWDQYKLPLTAVEKRVPGSFGRFLVEHSYAYNWLKAAYLSRLPPTLAGRIPGGPLPWPDIYYFRMRVLARIPEYSSSFGAWDPRKSDLDRYFEQDSLPPAFSEAIATTGYALDQFLLRAKRHNAKTLILMESRFSFAIDPKRRRARILKELAAQRGIPVIDMYDYLGAHHLDDEKGRFAHDGHWNEIGHRWAAEALVDAFAEHPEYCARGTRSQPSRQGAGGS